MHTILPRYLKPTQVAELLSLSRSAVYKKIEDGQIPSVRIGKTVRVPAAALYEQLERAERPAIESADANAAASFEREVGMSASDFCERWRQGNIEDTPENASRAIEALSLRTAGQQSAVAS